jgi:autotransporter-associated beta strand protein
VITLANIAKLNTYRAGLLAGTALVMLTVMPHSANATTATWSPSSNTWNTGSNWTGGTAPTLSGDSATFSTSGFTNPTLSANVTISSLTVTQGPYTITAPTGTTFTDNGTYSNPDVHLLTFNTSGTGSLVFSGSAILGNATGSGNSAAVAITTTGTGSVTISGTSSLNNSTDTIGAGTSLIITGSGSGGTASVISAGAIDISGTTGTTFGSLNGTGGTLNLGTENLSVGANGTNDSYAGVISGTGGSLTMTGTGTQTLSGANTYTGGTNFNAGTISIGAVGNLGSNTAGNVLTFSGGTLLTTAAVTLANNVTLNNFNNTVNTGAFTDTLSGAISGTGGLFKSGSGVLSLTGTNSYGGGNNIVAGTLEGTTASIIGNTADSGTLEFNQATNGTYAGTVSGTGALSSIGTGTLTLSGTNTYTGGTTISGGTVSISAQSNLGSNAQSNTITLTGGTLLTTAAVVSAQNITLGTGTNTINTGTFSDGLSSVISGTGGLTKTGTGTLTLVGPNTYSGGTTITAGTLEGTTNSLQGNIVNNGGTVEFIQNAAGVAFSGNYTGVISGTGGLTIAGTGGETVLNNANTFTGLTTISGGELTVGDSTHTGASIAGSAVVNSGGTLRGHGTIGGNVTNSGTVMPGASIGTLTISGNYTQPSTGTLAIEVTPTTSDMLNVGGTASLAGTLALTPDTGLYRPYTRYLIVSSSGGVSGTFGNITDAGTEQFATSYTANEVVLTALPNQSFASVAANNRGSVNEHTVAAALDTAYPIAALNSDPTFYNDLNNIYFSSPGQQLSAFNQLSGEGHADLGTMSLATIGAFNDTILSRMDERQGLRPEQTANNGMPGMFQVAQATVDDMGPLYGPNNGPVQTTDMVSPWIRGYGVFGHAGGTIGASDYGFSNGGIIAGADAKVTDSTLVGAAVAYDHTDYSVDPLNDTGNIDSFHVALYGTQKVDLPVVNTVVFDADASYAYANYQDQRVIAIPDVTSEASSHHNGNDYSVAGGISKPLDLNGPVGKITVLPRAGMEFDDIEQNAYSESGAGPLGLSTNGNSLDALRSIVGAKAAETFHTTGGTGLTPELRASWLHDFKDIAAPTTASFEGAPTVPFQVSGVNVGRDAAIVGTGLTASFRHGINAFMDYDATVRSNELDHTVSGGIRYTW